MVRRPSPRLLAVIVTVSVATFSGVEYRHASRFLDTDQAGRTLRVSILAAHVTDLPGAHVAVWLGANDRLRDWLQAGVEVSAGDTRPSLYLEVGHAGQQTRLDLVPWEFGKVATVSLHGDDGVWRATVNGKERKIRVSFLHAPALVQDVEMTQGSTVTATVNGRLERLG